MICEYILICSINFLINKIAFKLIKSIFVAFKDGYIITKIINCVGYRLCAIYSKHAVKCIQHTTSRKIPTLNYSNVRTKGTSTALGNCHTVVRV